MPGCVMRVKTQSVTRDLGRCAARTRAQSGCSEDWKQSLGSVPRRSWPKAETLHVTAPLPSRSVSLEDPFEEQVCDSGSIPGQSEDLGIDPRPWPCDLGQVPSPL